MYEILIFVIIVVPYALKSYLKNTEYSISARYANIIISFILFIFLFSEFRQQLWDFYKNGINSFYKFEQINTSENLYYLISSILYFTLCFYLGSLSLALGVRKFNSRKLLIKSLFFIWIILTNYLIVLYKSKYVVNKNIMLVFYSGLIIGIIILLLLYIYSRKSMKILFKEIPNNTRADL